MDGAGARGRDQDLRGLCRQQRTVFVKFVHASCTGGTYHGEDVVHVHSLAEASCVWVTWWGRLDAIYLGHAIFVNDVQG